MRRARRVGMFVATLAAALAAAATAGCGAGAGSPAGERSTATGQVAAPLTQREIVAKVRPSLVSIMSIPPGETTPPEDGGRHGHASGVVWDAGKGLVLTSDHFIEGAAAIHVVVGERTRVLGRAVARAQCNDFALIQLYPKPPDLVAIQPGDSAALRAGDQVTALGYLMPPGARRASLISTVGNVASVGVGGKVHPRLPTFPSLVLHQAPLQLAMSGGALVDDRGRLVGLNTLVEGGTGSGGGPYAAVSSSYLNQRIAELRPGKGALYGGWEDEHMCHDDMLKLSAKAMSIRHPPGS